MSFGDSIGNFVTVGRLAWKVYKGTKGAPDAFQKIHTDVLSLHAVLKEAEEIACKSSLNPQSQKGLSTIASACKGLLMELQELVNKYKSLGTQSKRTWDRVRWHNEDITDIRIRLNSNVTLLTALISISQASVLQKLEEFLTAFQNGGNENSIASTESFDSLSYEDRKTWRTIRKELEEIGITIDAFEMNRDLIFEWFKRAQRAGLFDEQAIVQSKSDSRPIVGPPTLSASLSTPPVKAPSQVLKRTSIDRRREADMLSPLPTQTLRSYSYKNAPSQANCESHSFRSYDSKEFLFPGIPNASTTSHRSLLKTIRAIMQTLRVMGIDYIQVPDGLDCLQGYDDHSFQAFTPESSNQIKAPVIALVRFKIIILETSLLTPCEIRFHRMTGKDAMYNVITDRLLACL